MKVKFFIENSQSAPFQVEWKTKVETLDFLPFPGMVLKIDNGVAQVSNLVYDLDNSIVEVYAKRALNIDTADPAVN